MKAHVKIIAVLFASFCMGAAWGHENCETNALIRKMLGPLLVKARLSGDRIVRMPRSISSQAEFFAGDGQWAEEEKRVVFDWYLNNLNFTASKALSGTPFDDGRRNALAEAAIRQCAAMSYTNALPAVEAYAVGDDMPARMESMELVFMWHGLDEWLVTFANGVVTNSAKYSERERNLAGRKFCGRLISSLQEGATNSPTWNAGVQAMYANRTNIACAVAIDAMLVGCMPGYAASSDRRLCADLIAANTNAWENCRTYFEKVVNTMPMSSIE